MKVALWLLAGVVVAGVLTGLATAQRSTVSVTLAVSGVPQGEVSATKVSGQSVGLTARARLARGRYLAILARREGESSSRSVVRCVRSPCTATWRELDAGTVGFTAIAWDVLDGKVRQLGTSKSISVIWAPPPSAPGTQPTHYVGRTSQRKPMSLDVSPDGVRITSLAFAEVDSEGACSVAGSGVLSGVAIPIPTSGVISAPVAAGGSFSYAGSDDFRFDDGTPGHVDATIAGRVSGSIAQGTVTITVAFQYEGVGQTCTGTADWSASRDAFGGAASSIAAIAPTYLRPASEPPRPRGPGP